MRFYYQSQDHGGDGQKVATKCIRVSSTATTGLLIETLIEKFRPDMKMLEVCRHSLPDKLIDCLIKENSFITGP